MFNSCLMPFIQNMFEKFACHTAYYTTCNMYFHQTQDLKILPGGYTQCKWFVVTPCVLLFLFCEYVWRLIIQFPMVQQVPQAITRNLHGITYVPGSSWYFVNEFKQTAIASADHLPCAWLHHVNDTFVMWQHGQDELVLLLKHLNGPHSCIQFTTDQD